MLLLLLVLLLFRPDVVAAVYMLHPLAILGCAAMGTGSIAHLSTLLAAYYACTTTSNNASANQHGQSRVLLSMFFIAVATYLTLYPGS
jgi:hypothetical protein